MYTRNFCGCCHSYIPCAQYTWLSAFVTEICDGIVAVVILSKLGKQENLPLNSKHYSNGLIANSKRC